MERIVNFRDRQEVLSEDFNNFQTYTQDAIDRLVSEAITAGRHFEGFAVAATSTTAASVGRGTYYVDGKRYLLTYEIPINFVPKLPAAAQRYAAITLTTAEVEDDIQDRSYLIDISVRPPIAEPRVVSMRTSRLANISVSYGEENATPAYPTIPLDTIAIAYVLLGPSGIVSVTRAVENELVSLTDLNDRVTIQENFQIAFGEQVETVRTDVAAIGASIKDLVSRQIVEGLAIDVARLKYLADVEPDHAAYGSYHFLTTENSDTAQPGYSALVEDGLHFPFVASTESELSLDNPNEARVKVSATGFVLPDYKEVPRISNLKVDHDLPVSQYQYETTEWQLQERSATRMRYGPVRTISLSSRWWGQVSEINYRKGTFTHNNRTYQILDGDYDLIELAAKGDQKRLTSRTYIRFQKVWLDEETEFYQEAVTTTHVVSGAQVMQTFPNGQYGWVTKILLKFTSLGASGSVTVLLTETKEGRPNTKRVIGISTVGRNNLKTFEQGKEKTIAEFPFDPVAIEPGKRYAIVVQTSGNHKIGTNDAEEFPDGALFKSAAGGIQQEDLTRNLAFQVQCAKFLSARAEVPMSSLVLPSGISDVDMSMNLQKVEGGGITFDVRPQGSATWIPLSAGTQNPLSGNPATLSLRANFIGTKDFMPGLQLTGSRVRLSKLGTAMNWVSLPEVFAATQSIKVHVILDNFRTNGAHAFALRLNDLTNGVNSIAAASYVDEKLDKPNEDGVRKRIRRTFTFDAAQLPTATMSVSFVGVGTVASITDLFYVEELIFLSF